MFMALFRICINCIICIFIIYARMINVYSTRRFSSTRLFCLFRRSNHTRQTKIGTLQRSVAPRAARHASAYGAHGTLNWVVESKTLLEFNWVSNSIVPQCDIAPTPCHWARRSYGSISSFSAIWRYGKMEPYLGRYKSLKQRDADVRASLGTHRQTM